MNFTIRWRSDQLDGAVVGCFLGTPSQTKVMRMQRTLTAQNVAFHLNLGAISVILSPNLSLESAISELSKINVSNIAIYKILPLSASVYPSTYRLKGKLIGYIVRRSTFELFSQSLFNRLKRYIQYVYGLLCVASQII